MDTPINFNKLAYDIYDFNGDDLRRIILAQKIRMTIIQWTDIQKTLPRRTQQFHKGMAGHVLIVGGDRGLRGAVQIAAMAALRVGAGLVTVATHPEHADFVNCIQPEIMSHGVRSKRELRALIEKADVLILGPGLGQSKWSKKMFKACSSVKLPLIVDADGLNWLSIFSCQRQDWILTPHLGEASRLLHSSISVVAEMKAAAAKKITECYNAICVLKGPGTLVSNMDLSIAICPAGNPGMASGGMGDALSGVIGGLVAQGLTLFNAAKAGVFIHALAGDLSAEQNGQNGMLATDLLPFIRGIVNNRYKPKRFS
jgi:hydroxyethylthiazole kinase-like uncharacterized protein yjeF